MTWKVSIIVIVVSAVGGGVVARLYMPRIETVDKIHETVKNNIVTRVVETTKNGVTTKETEIIDHTVEKKAETSKTTVVMPSRDWLVGADISLLPSSRPVYAVEVGRRILGPVFVVGSVATDLSVRAGVRVEF